MGRRSKYANGTSFHRGHPYYPMTNCSENTGEVVSLNSEHLPDTMDADGAVNEQSLSL